AAAGQRLTLGGVVSIGQLNQNRAFAVFGSATDTGTVVLSLPGGNTTGPATLEVAGGTLQAGNSWNPPGNPSFLPAVTVDAGATLKANGFDVSVSGLQGGGTVQIGGSTLRLGGVPTTTSSFGGTIAGRGGALLVATFVDLTLTGTSTISGTTIQTGANLTLGNGGSIVSSVANSGNFNINSGGSMAGSVNVANTGIFNINSGGSMTGSVAN